MSLLDAVRHRAYALLHRRRYEDERAEELLFHAWMESWRGARTERGRDSAESDLALYPSAPPNPTRGHRMRVPLTDWIRQDLGYAVRGLRRAPGFAVMVILTLTLGVGANAAVFSLLDRVYGQPPAGVADPASLRRMYIEFPDHPTQPGMIFPQWNYPSFSALRDAVRGTADVAGWTRIEEESLVRGESEQRVRASWVTHDYFDVLGVAPDRGRLFAESESGIREPTPVAVITHDLWKRAFGQSPDILGQTFELDGLRYTIVGVTPGRFAGLDLNRTDVFLPANTLYGGDWAEEDPLDQASGNYFRAVARLAPDGEESVLAAKATPARRHYWEGIPSWRVSESDPTANVFAGSIIEARIPTPADESMQVAFRSAGVTLIVLLIACANVASLMLVRASRREREIAIRLAVGVSRGRLLAQALTESLLLALVAGTMAVLMAVKGADLLRRLLMPTVEWVQPAVETRTALFTFATAALIGLIAGLAPALHAHRVGVSVSLKSRASGAGQRRSLLRPALLVTQGALSIVLLVGAGLFLISLSNVAGLRLGYDVDRVAWITPTSNGLDAVWSAEQGVAISERLRSIPGVEGVAFARQTPMRGWSSTRVLLPGADSVPSLGPRSGPQFINVDPTFFEVMGTRILEGRSFEPAAGGVIVGERMAKLYWPGRSAVGECLIIGAPNSPCTEVVGVVEDTRVSQIMEAPQLVYYLPLQDASRARAILLRIDPTEWSAIAPASQQLIEQHLEPRSVMLQRMSEIIEPQLRPWRLGLQLFGAFGLLALLVTAIGTYSVMAYTVSQRTHEMGVRIALGAKMRDLLRLVIEEGLQVILLAALLGVGLTLAAGKLIGSLLYGVTPRDPLTIGVAIAVLLVTGTVASLVPAWRAGRVDPVRALASE
jgi:putative ABC transport system permease protein